MKSYKQKHIFIPLIAIDIACIIIVLVCLIYSLIAAYTFFAAAIQQDLALSFLSAALLCCVPFMYLLFMYAMVLQFTLTIRYYLDNKMIAHNAYIGSRFFPMPLTGDSVEVLLCGAPVELDLLNLYDPELCCVMCYGVTEQYSSGHLFSIKNAILAVKKQGKRLFSEEEIEFICTLPMRWDKQKKGCWITFKRAIHYSCTCDVKVFFPFPGYFTNEDDYNDKDSSICYEKVGFYWGAPATDLPGAYTLFLTEKGGLPEYKQEKDFCLSVRGIKTVG